MTRSGKGADMQGSTASVPFIRKPFFRPKEVAEYLDVHVNTIYRWINEGKLDGRKISHSVVRIPWDAVIDISNKST